MSKNKPLEYIEEVYNEHYRYLRNFLIGLTKSDAIADDIIQELFTKILMTPTKIFEVNYMKSWLVKSAKNTLIDYYRKKKPELLSDENVIESLLIDNYTPEVSALMSSEIETVLNQFSTEDKAIMLAKEYYGYRYEEISELLNIPVSTLKSRVFRMRKSIVKRRLFNER